jgi:hypothetical protein
VYTTGNIIHYSPDKIPLLYMSDREMRSTRPVLTTENKPFCSQLFVVHLDGHVEAVESNSRGAIDPDVMFDTAIENDWDLDIKAYEAVIGYWVVNKGFWMAKPYR